MRDLLVTSIYIFAIFLCFVTIWIRRMQRIERERIERLYAHCLCGERLSEWFIDQPGGCMYHPECVSGCGWVSPWASHQE
jgi:hypothetical protein